MPASRQSTVSEFAAIVFREIGLNPRVTVYIQSMFFDNSVDGGLLRPFGGLGTSVNSFTPLLYLRCGFALCFKISASRCWNGRAF